ncbi:hypothetical protein D0Y65_025573 [Glycine soja]|uniref:Uncharacterized protein n=1 Tax=Glycine soja TaxID=3848 RepID=A0A445IFU0_GLYSO|nr:hypothetical protein D0Y65_025573 [Glycine soja]
MWLIMVGAYIRYKSMIGGLPSLAFLWSWLFAFLLATWLRPEAMVGAFQSQYLELLLDSGMGTSFILEDHPFLGLKAAMYYMDSLNLTVVDHIHLAKSKLYIFFPIKTWRKSYLLLADLMESHTKLSEKYNCIRI